MWELGVRHALKPHHTIMICEKEQMSELPFDINHFPIHYYVHTEEGIPNREIDRFQKHLTGVVLGILSQNPSQIDSPVHTFLKINSNENLEIEPSSFASIMDVAETAKENKDYTTALEKLAIAKVFALGNMTLKDNLSFIISRQALCTYKYKNPTEQKALVEAQKILEELKMKKVESNKGILRILTEDISIRTGKYGTYVYYCTTNMKKPDFISLKKFRGGFMTCEPKVLLEWVESQKKESRV
jgi:hypothetical protein